MDMKLLEALEVISESEKLIKDQPEVMAKIREVICPGRPLDETINAIAEIIREHVMKTRQ